MWKNEFKNTQTIRGEFGVSHLELKEISDEGEFEGYASVFGVRDQGYDIVERGAFTESLSRRGAKGVKMLWHHNPTDIRGVWTELREDDRGLWCRGRVLKDLSKGRDTITLLKEKALDGLSIGYRTERYTIDEEAKARRLQKVDLIEISLVTFPMNQESLISRVKSDNLPTEREFEQFLARDAGFSVRDARAIIANGYKSLIGARDAADGGDDNKELIGQANNLIQQIRSAARK